MNNHKNKRTLFLATVCAVAITLLAGGCESVNQSAPVQGGNYQVNSPLADFHETLSQGHNANSPSTLLRTLRSFDADGKLLTQVQTKVQLGTSRDPVITVKPTPAYGQYAVAIIGALSMIAGAVMAFKSWPKIGGTIAIGGFVVMVIALTAGAYGWLWALLAAAVCAVAAATLYSGYRSGLSEGLSEQPLPTATPTSA